MGILQKAYKTFVGIESGKVTVTKSEMPLAPVGHAVRQPELEITILADGSFSSARVRQIKKVTQKGVELSAESKICIPVTEASESRTSNAKFVAHPLCDYVRYMLPENTVSYQAYVELLSGWCDFSGNAKLRAVLAYVQSGTILDDLASFGIKFPNIEKVMVCWVVNGIGPDSGPVWEDKVLQRSWAEYYMHLLRQEGRETGLCMITGEQTVLASLAGLKKAIVPAYGSAKLASSESSGNNKFTYRGRFGEAWQAMSLGYEASQQAFSALVYLVGNQGVAIGDKDAPRVFLCWSPDGIAPPDVAKPLEVFGASGRAARMSDYKVELMNALQSWKTHMPDDSSVVFTILDSPSTGCLSVLYYNEFGRDEYLQRLYDWDSVCCAGGLAPMLDQMVQYAYGVPRNGKYEIRQDIRRNHLQRMIICRAEGMPIPRDVVSNLVRNAGRLQFASAEHVKGASPRDKLLRAACAAVRKYIFDTKGDLWSMDCNENVGRADRGYLYGCLLSLADCAEGVILRRENAKHETSALRYQQAFVQAPCSTWSLLRKRLVPYLAQMSPVQRNWYENKIMTIMCAFDAADYKRNRPLEDTWVLGYYQQRNEIFRRAPKDEEVNKATDGATDASNTDGADSNDVIKEEE